MRRFSSLSGPVWGGCCQTSRNSSGGVTAGCSKKPGVRALDCARALLPPHASRAIEPAIAHARVRKHLRVLKKVEITVPSSARFMVSLAAPELIYSLCLRPYLPSAETMGLRPLG